MNGMIKALWAAVAIAIVMVTNILPANAQQRSWRREGAAAPASSGDACVSVDRAVATLEALCKNPAYASCGRCAQYKPCMNGCTPGTATPPPGGPVTYSYSQECAPNQPEVAGCKVEEGKVTCATRYYPITVGTRSIGSGNPNVRAYVLQKRCFPGDRSEKEIAEINEQIRKLIEADAKFAKMLAEFSDRLDRVEAEVAGLRGKIAEARQLAITANIKVDELKGRVDAIENGLVALDQELQQVKSFTATMGVGYRFGGALRGSHAGSGITHHLTVTWVQNLNGTTPWNVWAEAAVGVLTCDGCDPKTAGSATMYHGGGALGIGYEVGESRQVNIMAGVYAHLTAPPDQLTQNGMGRQFGPMVQIGWTPSGLPLNIHAVGGLGVINKQNYFMAGNNTSDSMRAGADTGIGGYVGIGAQFRANIF
jgi:hypothetical protein